MSESKDLFSHLEFMVILVTLICGFLYLIDKIERQINKNDILYNTFIYLMKDGGK